MAGQGKKGGKKSGSYKGRSANFEDLTLADYANSTVPSGRVGKPKTSINVVLEDLTLADFANSNVTSGKKRIGKAKASFNFVREVKQLNTQDKAWDEKLDEFEGDFDFVKEENEQGEEVYVMKKVSCRRKKTLGESLARKGPEGKEYPVDIWHLISNYIRPEDVAVFSAICRNAWSVVRTPTFWFKLYNRYYKDVQNLPTRLKPECMRRHYGLKACVVRSLFYMYPPLAARVDRAANMTAPYHLKSRQCISMWQERYCNKWKLSFKLRRKDFQQNQSSKEKTDLMEILSDIFANPDEGCSILQMISCERMMLPVVMGLMLHSININLDITMPHMNVQLVFGSGRICNGKLDTTGTETVSLKTVLVVSVLDWWHPHYPHHNTIVRSNEHES